MDTKIVYFAVTSESSSIHFKGIDSDEFTNPEMFHSPGQFLPAQVSILLLNMLVFSFSNTLINLCMEE